MTGLGHSLAASQVATVAPMDTPRLRKAARALVLDPDDRVLLVHFRFSDGDLWAPPGGGIDHGETPIDAVRRELHEEVGYTDLDIGPPIWTRTVLFRLSEHYDGQTETVYLVRVDGPPQSRALLTDEQLRDEYVFGHAWWSISELHSATATFSPSRLRALVTDLIASGPPDDPIDAGV